MRRKRIFLFCLVFGVFACTQEMPESLEPEIGRVSVTVQTHEVELVSKAVTNAEFVPEVDDLKIEIFKNPGRDQIRLYRDTYANTLAIEGGYIPLNCADYRILASYGDSLGVGFKPEDIYYSGTYDFTLEPNESEVAVVDVSPSNVRASVVFGENLKFDYSGFYAKVRSETPSGKVKSLRFDYDETRSGFVPYGKVRVELYVNINGEDLYYPGQDMEVSPGDDITFKLNTVRLESEVVLQIEISQPETETKQYEVPALMLPKDAPDATQGGLDQGTFTMEPGDQPYDDLRLDLKVDGGIRNCWLNIDSEYLESLGVPSRVDLASETLGLDDSLEAEHIIEILKGVGLDWMGYMAGSRLAYVDFSGVTEYMSTTPCTPLFDADFSVEVVDSRPQNPGTQHIGSLKTDTYSFNQVIPVPEITVSGFDRFDDRRVIILEGNGVTYNGLNAKLQAKGGIAHCWLNVDSPYLVAEGVTGTRFDLANIDEESMEAVALRRYGVSWTRNMAGLSDAVIDFSDLTDYMDSAWCDGKTSDFAKFSIELENAHYGSESERMAASEVGEFDYVVPKVTIRNNVLEGNVWAKKILDFSVDCIIDAPQGITLPGNQFKLQYSTGDGWNDISSASYSYPTLSCARLDVQPSVKYEIRAVYHDNPNLTVNFNSYTSESELQVEGASFDDWEVMIHSYYTEKVYGMGGTYLSRDYYQPLPSSWWAVNSKKTMPDKTSPNFTLNIGSISYETGETQPYKVFPTVTRYNSDPDGSGSTAQIATMHVCNMATQDNAGDGFFGSLGDLFSGLKKEEYVSHGEMCIGSADASGNLSYGGHTFASRPSKISFKYQYDSRDSEKGYFKFELRSGNTVIATHEFMPSGTSEWKTYTFDVFYLDEMTKATSIFMTFKSTSDGSPYYKDNGAITLNVAGTDYKVHCGSVLRIDDIQLIYE